METEVEYIQTGVAARILQCSPDLVRYLERTGQLPAAIKTSQGFRLFDRRVVEQMARKRDASPHAPGVHA